MDGGSTYQSYLLRLWRDNPRAPWQASLQSTATEKTFHFADVGHMWAFLQAQMAGEGDPPEEAENPTGQSGPGVPD
jgi:hypothetical protein